VVTLWFMDFTIDHGVNAVVRAHPLLVEILKGFSTWGIAAFAVAVFGLWLLDAPRRSSVMRLACASGLAAAALGLVLNQLVILVWQRPRPYQEHPGSIVPLIAPSHDPSFPSDHAAAAFAIAIAVLLVAPKAGRVFVAWALLIAVSRVLVGVHYPSDVIAGAAVGATAAVAVVRYARPLVDALVRLVARVTDPLLERIAAARFVRSTLGSHAFRQWVVLTIGLFLLAAFAQHLRGHVLDEMPLTALAAWAVLVFVATRGIAGDPVLRRRHLR
jgi:undecaprenyl-diphosphatase